MSDKIQILRKTLSANIKKQRENAELTQEKLAEKAGISANMINDIEGCRSLISDKTLGYYAQLVRTFRFMLCMSSVKIVRNVRYSWA